MLNIDYKLMMEQDPALKEYIKDCIFEVTLMQDDMEKIVVTIFSFYNIGMSAKDVVKFFEQNKRLGQ